MDREMMMMTAVPLSSRGLLLKAYRKEMPSTDPGMMYGNMVTVSRMPVRKDFFLTVR